VKECLVDRGPSSWFARPMPIHFDPTLKRFCFERLHLEHVEETTKNRALEVFKYCIDCLGLTGAPPLAFFRPVDWRQVGLDFGEGQHFRRHRQFHINADGYVPSEQPTEIWIRHNLSTPALEVLVAHELRHIWQQEQKGRFFSVTDAETDAYSYGYQTALRFLNQRREAPAEIVAVLNRVTGYIENACLAERLRHPLEVWRNSGSESRRRPW
jgi:hypothetical protein